MFTPIQKILPKAISSFGIGVEARAALVCEKYRKFAPRLIHANALKYTFPKSYSRKILTIGVGNPAWAQQIIIHKDELLKAMNESLGENMVSDIKTKVATRTAI